MTNITFQGTPIHTVGRLPETGKHAPDFTLTKTDLSEIHLKKYAGKKIILNIFPSLDTSTCAAAMRHFNEIASQHPEILILCISADLPFAQKRFCSAEHLENVQPVSVFRHPEFGDHYGVTISDGPLAGLLSRAVLVLNEHGVIIYTQQVTEITEEPDYTAITKIL
ncbi:MAG TPA: thiol peroxidase [Gammaproteobacteria bacterium]|jgi:thiol peroxidase|nr:thiol peroxidase [Gammaproteobacteria bacterium]